MAYAKRWTRVFSGVALAAAAGLAAAGCTSGTASTTNEGAGAAGALGPASALTAAQARQVFDSYVATSDKAAVTNDETLALSDVSGVQKLMLSTSYESADYYGQRPLATRYAYGTPVFYLPEQDGYPQWFVAEVPRTQPGTPADAGTNWPAGVLLPFSGRVLMLFEKPSAASAWQLASSSQLAPGQSVPQLATDGHGHVTSLPTSTTTLLARPDVVGPLQAAVVDDGPASAAARVVANGPLTTGMYLAARTSVLGLSAPPGDVRQWELEGANYTKFALRTANGGALVFYAMYLNTTIEVPAKLNDSLPVNPGPPITVPAYLIPLLPARKTAPRVQLESQELLSFAAVDPPTGSAKIKVIAVGGGLSYAFAS